ncbi:MAG: TRAP transporter small permease subunit [Candidatus Atribacteria bacterium]|nr:TRAP transporter small permease subunit [Candidatus Atribacteria bacterium]
MNNFLKQIDKISHVAGLISSWFILLQMLVVVLIVIERYFFSRGDDWAYELSWMFFSLVMLFSFAFTLTEKGHVRVDIIFDQFSPRIKGIIDSLCYLALFIIAFLIVWFGIDFAREAWRIRECSWHTTVGAPVYYIKSMIPLSFGFLGLQSLVELIRSITNVVKGEQK